MLVRAPLPIISNATAPKAVSDGVWVGIERVPRATKKEKSTKKKGFKSYHYHGDDDDDGGKGSKKHSKKDKHTKKEKHGRSDDSNNSKEDKSRSKSESRSRSDSDSKSKSESKSDSKSESKSEKSRNDYDHSEHEKKTPVVDDKNPLDEYYEPIGDDIRAIIAEMQPVYGPNEYSDHGRIIDYGNKENTETDNTTTIPTDYPSKQLTDDSFDVFEAPLDAHFANMSDHGIRTVQLMHPGNANECIKYDHTIDNKAVFMAECSTTAGFSVNEDHWEILEVATPVDSGELFNLRHKASQLCIPINPENPDLPFNCDRYFGMEQAIADSFTGLVDCESDFAAAFEMDGVSNSFNMNNSGCEEEGYQDPDLVFMTYTLGQGLDAKQVVVWGTKILLSMGEVVAMYNFNSEWTFVDV